MCLEPKKKRSLGILLLILWRILYIASIFIFQVFFVLNWSIDFGVKEQFFFLVDRPCMVDKSF